jgi:hypothetical protein
MPRAEDAGAAAAAAVGASPEITAVRMIALRWANLMMSHLSQDRYGGLIE